MRRTERRLRETRQLYRRDIKRPQACQRPFVLHAQHGTARIREQDYMVASVVDNVETHPAWWCTATALFGRQEPSSCSDVGNSRQDKGFSTHNTKQYLYTRRNIADNSVMLAYIRMSKCTQQYSSAHAQSLKRVEHCVNRKTKEKARSGLSSTSWLH
ncbi:hypothetical protein CBL_07267 [Carabus blaptoides fortunei]